MAPVNQQNTFYRRGLVLGLTMAEIMLLVLFALLIALGAVLASQKDTIQEIEDKYEVLKDENEKLTSSVPYMQEMRNIVREIQKAAREAGLSTIPEFWTHIKNVQTNSEFLQREVEMLQKLLAEADEDLEKFRKVIKAAGIEPTPEALERALKTLERALAEIELQSAEPDLAQELQICRESVASISKQCKGTTKPACWSTNGEYQTIYHVALFDAGMMILPRKYPEWMAARKAPLEGVRFNVMLTPNEFRTATLPVLRWSQKQNPECRFFVRVYDKTGSTNKPIYKKHLWTVEESFYPDEMKITPWPGRVPVQ